MKLLQKIFVVWLWLVPLVAVSAPAVNINTASPAALVELLEGVGPQKAKAIVAYRKSNGPFKKIEDLSQVSGIGVKTIEQNRSRILLGSSTKKVSAKTKP